MKLKLLFLLLLTFLAIESIQAQSFECRVENESFPSSTTYEFDVKLYAKAPTTSWEYASGVYYINMNSAFRNAGTITASIVAGTSDLLAAQVPTSVTYNATNNYAAIAAKTPPGAGAGTIIDQNGKRVIRLRLTNTVNYSTTAAPNLTWRWATTPNTGITAYVGGVSTAIASSTATAGQSSCKTPNYWTGNSWNKGNPTDTTDAVIFAGTYSGSITARSLIINYGATYYQNGGNLVLTYPIRNFGTLNGTYLIQSLSDANGTISPNGNYYTGTDSIHQFVFKPNTGYLIDSVLVNGIKVDSTISYTFKNVNANQTIRVTFKPIQININAQAGANGQINPSGNSILTFGNQLRYTFIPDLGYRTESVMINGTKVDSLLGYTFSNSLSDQNITVTFKRIFSIEANAGSNGFITDSGINFTDSAENQSYTFIPNTGYKVDSVIVNGVKVDSTTSYTFSNITTDQTIRVSFTPIVYSITTQSNSNGTTNPTGSINVNHGSNQRITFIPNAGYYIDSVLVDGIPVDSIAGYTFSNVTTDHNLRVVYTLKYNVASVSQTANSNQYIAYQAYARNNAGASLNDKTIQVKFSLLSDSINGSVVYAESHSLSTNAMGLFTAEIGKGTPNIGTWLGINWSSSKKYLKTEIDMGSGWVNMGTQQLLAVPFAIHSNTSSKSQTLENANLPVFNTNAAAINAGLLPGQLYRTTQGDLKVVY